MKMLKNVTDFIIDAPKGRDFVVLQISDPQIIDSGKVRFFERLNPVEKAYWATEKKEERCYGYLRDMITNTNPDLILVTGDLVYGEFDDDGKLLDEFIAFMESFGIWWAPVFGNHDNETVLGAAWQADRLENAEHCLFKRGHISGNGNYTVGIRKGDELERVFVMLDTHGFMCEMGLRQDQIEWYNGEIAKIKTEYPEVKIAFVMHVQPIVFADALARYGFNEETISEKPIDIDGIKDRADTDFGYVGFGLKNPWDKDRSVWKNIKALGTDAIIVSHQHSNSASVVYEGVRLQFGQKSTTYDRANYVTDDGDIVCSFTPAGKPIIGGTVFSLRYSDGKIVNAHIYYCKNSARI